MGNIAVKVDDVWKQYRKGSAKAPTLRESMSWWFRKRAQEDDFWALREISFEVKHGEAIGIIGRNGAGKSTLLKILSSITYPTKGRVDLYGRVASLLEVGTGFHPELTGRENVFLNGTILGMTRSEVKAKFDEIIAFSGVEGFIDTPIKHYSSGMKVRLAFAVAAHLDPEILIIDEVLAVGDADFQKKCLGKMEEVAGEGRTVLFVSHNMAAVGNLCARSLLVDVGQVKLDGDTASVVEGYLTSNTQTLKNVTDLSGVRRTQKDRVVEFKEVVFETTKFDFGKDVEFDVILKRVKGNQTIPNIEFAFAISNMQAVGIIHGSNLFTGHLISVENEATKLHIEVENALRPGTYYVTLFLRVNGDIQDWLSNVCSFLVKDGNPFSYNNTNEIQGVVFPNYVINVEF